MDQFLEEQRKKIALHNQLEFTDTPCSSSSCARANTKHIDRSIQIKREKIDNVDGPLAKTIFPALKNIHTEYDLGCDGSFVMDNHDEVVSDGLVNYYPKRKDRTNASQNDHAIKERLENLESILIKSKDLTELTVMQRIKRLENALMNIENKYPMIALHLYDTP